MKWWTQPVPHSLVSKAGWTARGCCCDLHHPTQSVGVLASMSMSLLKEDRLWGLISCSNRQPLHVPHALRATCQTIGQVVSMQIGALEDLQAQRQRQSRDSLRKLLEDAWSLLTPQALDKFIDLTFTAEPALKIMADPQRMFQVLSNLVANAIKFTRREGRISVTAMVENGLAVMTVADSGTGIAADRLPHVFERYWRIREGNPSGSGLGLYIFQGIVRAHGGELTASSEPGAGSVFRVTVPAAIEP
ncbi:ATP-binding protein [Pseudomonas sp. LP_7_YM]|uniref:GAF domain-containing sensor histidine kinase n=1 Tax=Pseudomonas sp. LP_7_YM TaxID=2485137 RepID=UPI001414E393